MGLISATMGTLSSTMKDQYKEFFYCDAIGSDTFAVQGQKKVKRTLGFASASDNVISNGSKISVADGQCMIIVEDGQVVDICAVPGEYIYDTDLEPSLFTGNLGESIKDVFLEIGKRFQFGGMAGKDQRVYYFNTKEIPGMKYGTPSPIPFRVVDTNIHLDVDISIKCFGEYSIKIKDPILFYTNVCGNFSGSYKVENLASQLKSEMLSALQPAFADLSKKGIRYSQLPGATSELCASLNEALSKQWRELRGIEIVNLSISSLKADEKDEEMIKTAQRNVMYQDPSVAAATLVGAQAQAMVDAANNTNGAVNGFMGVNMAQGMGGVNANNLYQQAQTSKSSTSWVCPKCGSENTGNFCGQCGSPKPTTNKWFCSNCGKENTGNFCSSCGSKKPE